MESGKLASRAQGRGKAERQYQVLLSLVKLFVKEGKPVGSKTLRDAGCGDISSATVRNYFASLEKRGYLTQQHSSGGRLPTPKAYRFYANHCLENRNIVELLGKKEADALEAFRKTDNTEIGSILEKGAELLSDLTQCAVFLSAPRFDHDFVRDLKLVSLDDSRCLCVIMTSFGLVRTEILHSEQKLSTFSIKRIEAYFHWRLTGQDEPEKLPEEELRLAQRFYNEALVRYIVGYSNFFDEEIYRTGFSQLLVYPDFDHIASLSKALALFEDPPAMRRLLRESLTHNSSKVWIGEELPQYQSKEDGECAVIVKPYAIGPKAVGAIGLLGPMRMPYDKQFEILRYVSEAISEVLTNNVYRFSITYRQPLHEPPSLEQEQQLLLEDQRQRPENS